MATSLQKDTRKILDIARQRGCTVDIGGGSHFKVTTRDGKMVAVAAVSPSSHRAVDNLVGDLRRAGVFETDPRKEGQVATATRRPLSNRQQKLKNKLDEVLKALNRRELAEHVLEITNASPNGRKFASVKAIQWHIQQLVGHEKPISSWVAEYLETAADDILKPAPAIETVKPAPVETDDAKIADTKMAAELYAIAMSIQNGMKIPIYNGRVWGHGTWQLVGKVAIAAAERHGLTAKRYARTGDSHISDSHAIGVRIRDYIQHGKTPFQATKRVMEAMIADWDEGYRVTPAMLVNSKLAGKPIPDNLRGKDEPVGVEPFAGTEVPASVSDTDDGPWTVKGLKTMEVEPEPDVTDEQMDKFVEAAFEGDRVKAGTYASDEKLAADEVAVSPSKVPLAWEDGSTPLHLKMIESVLLGSGTPLSTIGVVIQTAKEVLLMELREA